MSGDSIIPIERASGRGPKVAVGVVIVLGLVALYAAFGGGLPFIAEGGPALDSVPSEADVVVYTDAWTFSSETSRDVVDGVLTVSNESLPGYTGPASLNSAFQALKNTTLDPKGLRSVTAFGSYDQRGRVGRYQGLIIKTTWNRNEILSAFGGSRDAYEKRQYNGKTVFVERDGNSTLPWIAQLEGDQFVLGTGPAVKDSIDAHAGRDSGINATLRSRFESLDRAPVRFAAAMPQEIPGESILPDDVARTVSGIETIGGIYYPDGDHATVKLTIGTTDAANATRLEPAMRDALTATQSSVPDDTDSLLQKATVTRSGTAVTVSMSGPVEAFVGGYRALVETGLVNLIVGKPVGDPALHLVPDDATAVGYADAGIVTDPTAQMLFERLLSTENTTRETADRTAVDRVFDGLETISIAELSSFRSVTVFGRDIESNDTDAAAIIQSRWTRDDIRDAIEAANASYRRETYRNRPVFVVTEDNESVWITPLSKHHQVLGTADAVRSVIDVSRGSQPALSGPLATSIRNSTSYLRVASVVPAAVTDAAGPFSDTVKHIDVIAASYDTEDERVVGRVDLHFTSKSKAREGKQAVSAVLTLGSSNIDDEQLERLVESIQVTREERVVTLTAETDPETLLKLIDQLEATIGDGDRPADRQRTLLPAGVPSAGEPL